MRVHIRPMLRADMPAAEEIEIASFEFPWGALEWAMATEPRHCFGLVAEYADSVVGYMTYEALGEVAVITNLAVSPGYRRNGVASELVKRLRRRVDNDQYRAAAAYVRDSNLSAHLFFKSQGFRALCVDRSPKRKQECDDDGYLFRYTARQSRPARNL